MSETATTHEGEAPTVYGPVRSWRVGLSLGVDLLCVDSVCSLRCAYCQLGRIRVHTAERRTYVPTARAVGDLRRSDWRRADVVAFSGSGEPTLALNLRAAIRAAKSITRRPVVVLTNSTTLTSPAVRRDLREADRVFCKLDAADEETFRRLNRPAEGLTLRRVIEGVKSLRAEYGGHLAIQTMMTRPALARAEEFARLVAEIGPDEVQLNTPTRAVPRDWSLEARGNLPAGSSGGVPFRQITAEEAARFERAVRGATAARVSSAFRR